MKKGKYRNLFENMALFTVGNFVSKLLVMLLVPFYTNVLTTAEYGIADGMQATLLLLVPLLTLNIGEAALRFGIEKENGRGNVLGIVLKYVMIADAGVLLVCLILWKVLPERTFGIYALLFAALFICNSIYECMILFCQGCEQVKIMIVGSISCTFLVIVSNLYFLLVLRIGLYGYLVSQMISFLGASLIMLVLMGKTVGRIEMPKKGDALDDSMRSYGTSMLLYSTSSWVNNAMDRYFVLGLCGAAAGGLYGVAYKIPAILTVFQRIFAQAWQISANKNYREEDAAPFFASVYRGYQAVMAVGCSGLILLVRLVARLLFAKDFYQAWQLVPPLLISVIFGALTGFLGSICLAYKDGKSMGWATGIGAVVNIVLNYIMIRQIGPLGAAIATMISYYTMYEMAYRMVKRHVDMGIRRGKDFLAYFLILTQAVSIMWELPGQTLFTLSLPGNVWNVQAFYILQLICCAGICVMYAKPFAELVMKKLKRR